MQAQEAQAQAPLPRRGALSRMGKGPRRVGESCPLGDSAPLQVGSVDQPQPLVDLASADRRWRQPSAGKLKQKGKKVKVTCKVSYPASSNSSRIRWRLTHDGRVVRRGRASRGRLQLSGLVRAATCSTSKARGEPRRP